MVELFKNTVFHIAYCYLKNKADADDVTQEVFLKLYTYEKVFENDEHIKAWLIRVTVNSSKNLLKANKRRLFVPIESVKEIPAETDCENNLLSLIMKMKTDNRFVLYMHYYEGYSVKDISKILGINESAVTSRLYRGRKQLEKLMKKEGYNYV